MNATKNNLTSRNFHREVTATCIGFPTKIHRSIKISDLKCGIRNVYEEEKHSQNLVIKKTLALSISINKILMKA